MTSSRCSHNRALCQLKWVKLQSNERLRPLKEITGRSITLVSPAQLLLNILRPFAQSLISEHLF